MSVRGIQEVGVGDGDLRVRMEQGRAELLFGELPGVVRAATEDVLPLRAGYEDVLAKEAAGDGGSAHKVAQRKAR